MKKLLPLLLVLPATALAADHAEAPGAAADTAADIGDVYAWHTDDGNLVAVVTYGVFQAAGGAALYDADVLYTVHIDNNNDGTSDHDIHVRFGQNTAGEWGVQVTDLPGATDAQTVGAAGTTLDAGGGAQVYTGLRDDPFFFDAQGFNDTLATGTIAFTGTDGVAGLDVTAIVLEFPYTSISVQGEPIRVWATTSRVGG
jgi:hypothetical protein